MARVDVSFPFRIDPASNQAARTDYASHVAQMVRQVLLTAPGERVCLSEFGCGLRQLLFAPHSEALDAAVALEVQRALERWLGAHLKVRAVTATPGAGDDDSQLLVEIEYELVETREATRLSVLVGVP